MTPHTTVAVPRHTVDLLAILPAAGKAMNGGIAFMGDNLKDLIDMMNVYFKLQVP